MAKIRVTIQMPDREPGEPDITEDQIAEIKSHDADVKTAFLRTLGRYQAAVFIRQIAEKQLEIAFGATDDRPAKRSGCLSLMGWVTVGLAICWLFSLCSH
jgi:hypothetical protein